MKKHTLWLLALLAVAAGCKKEQVAVRFLVTAESPTQEEATKTHLVDERYVCWDDGDQFTINTNVTGQAPTVATYENGEYNAYFESYLDYDANIFCALYPHSTNNVIEMNNSGEVTQLKCDFPASQPFRDDYTFGTNACPMVAYETRAGDPPFHLQFHNLCGIVRVEFYGTHATQKEVRKVEFVEANGKQISGLFTVNDHDTYYPYLTATDPGTDASKKITIECTRRIGSGEPMMTFYLVLPALQGTTSYKLHMTVTNNEGNQYKKTLTVPIRRNGITKAPAIAISEWGVPAAGGTGSGSITITGNGTKSRPFQIYSAADLAYLRDRYEYGTLNTYPLNKDTYIQVMRSDIVLTNSNWTRGISGFIGHFIYHATASSAPGITNNSNQPIFNTIYSNGVVEGLTVKGTSAQNTAEAKEFSPLCGTNSGKIIDCMVASNASFTLTSTNPNTGTGIAGICVHNNDGGIIEGCGCSGQLDSRDHVVAGICLHNHTGGIIRGCYISSPMLATRCLEAAGICYDNRANGVVENCYFAANTNSSTSHWGGIVYKNLGNVSRCYVDRSGVIGTTRSVGGIVNTNNGGIVDRCWNSTDRMQTSSTVNDGIGGLIYHMVGGELRNSYCNIPTSDFSASTGWVGGAIAEMSGGTACNSYAFSKQSQLSGHKGTFVGNLTGGAVKNCYGRSLSYTETRFYGAIDGTPTVTHCCDYAATGAPPSGLTHPANIATLLATLNGWSAGDGANSDYYKWVNSTGTNATSIHSISETFPDPVK